MLVENITQIKRRITINVDMSKKDYAWNPSIRTYENGKYLGNITADSEIT